LYALASYGQEGIEHALDMLKDELETCMALMGTTAIDQIRPEFVWSKSLYEHTTVTKDYLREDTYLKLRPVPFSKL